MGSNIGEFREGCLTNLPTGRHPQLCGPVLCSMAIEIPRGILPDAIDGPDVILIKACSSLRLTYEIRLATFMARKAGGKVRLMVREDCFLDPALMEFAATHGLLVERRESRS